MARKNFRDLRAKMSPERRKRNDARIRELAIEISLQELRRTRKLTQEMIAHALKMEQASVSKLERRDDMLISTLRRYVQGLGGRLEIVARFPDGNDVRINQLGENTEDPVRAKA